MILGIVLLAAVGFWLIKGLTSLVPDGFVFSSGMRLFNDIKILYVFGLNNCHSGWPVLMSWLELVLIEQSFCPPCY